MGNGQCLIELLMSFIVVYKIFNDFYWFVNNWHYISKWDHLKNAVTLNPASEAQKASLLALQQTQFPASDAIMSRCISTAISLLWTDEQIKDKGEKLAAAIRKVIGKF
jgi:8-amino-3,8-dideoxy-alpha-D-manno-octulosonate transaminase